MDQQNVKWIGFSQNKFAAGQAVPYRTSRGQDFWATNAAETLQELEKAPDADMRVIGCATLYQENARPFDKAAALKNTLAAITQHNK